jgi:hypothetical protein
MYAIGIICVQFRLEKQMGYIAITFQWICLYGIKPIITSMNFACHGHKQLSIEMTLWLSNDGALIWMFWHQLLEIEE